MSLLFSNESYTNKEMINNLNYFRIGDNDLNKIFNIIFKINLIINIDFLLLLIYNIVIIILNIFI
jgi:hypothetical protein